MTNDECSSQTSESLNYSSTDISSKYPIFLQTRFLLLNPASTLKSSPQSEFRPPTGNMVMRVGVGIVLVLMVNAFLVSDARQLMKSDLLISSGLALGVKNDQVCTLCETYAAQAIEYLSQNETQLEVIDQLHTSCSRLRSFEDECDTLVDYYAPLFFLALSDIQPAEFCEKLNLCELLAVSSQPVNEDSCGICHQAVAEVISKLQDPDSQLDILETLLKGCESMDKKFVKKCKRLVFEYGPLILAKGAKFLQNSDICTTLHACGSKVSNI